MQTGKPDDWMLRADGQAENAEQGMPKTKNPVIFMTGFSALLVTPRGFEPRLPP